MPPHRPAVLRLFLGKLTRRLSLQRLRRQGRLKRGGGEAALAEAIPSPDTPEQAVEAAELTESIDRFLASLPDTERDMFVCRYWFLVPIAEIGVKFDASTSKTKSILFRIRNKLKAHLEREGLI